MKNKLEYILLSILLGLSVLLGLSFWLNTFFNFNIFCATHWDEFAKLQATQTPISIGFYISFAVAISIFIIGMLFIYRSGQRTVITKDKELVPLISEKLPAQRQDDLIEKKPIEPVVSVDRPPRLNLPNNMAQIVHQNHASKQEQALQQNTPSESPYNPIISEIFSNAGYIVKSNPKMAGFVPNLFAIGNNEIVWIGGVDCDIEKMMAGIQKLDSVFKETLEDIQIHINAFILDTLNRYDSTNTDLLIFKSVDELKAFIEEHTADSIEEFDQESFDSYSEYIDTIIKYIKNV